MIFLNYFDFSTELGKSRSKELTETERKLRKKGEELSEIRANSFHQQKEIHGTRKKLNKEFKEFKESTYEGAVNVLKEKLDHVASTERLVGKLFEEERDKMNETFAIQKEYIENLKRGTLRLRIHKLFYSFFKTS